MATKGLESWLVASRKQDSATLTVDYLSPDPSHDEDAIIARLGHELRRNYMNPAEVASILESFGASKLADHLLNNKLPTTTAIRHGEFGEALSGVIFRRTRRYCVPIMKLRYKQGRNQPHFLADILAFRFRYDPPVVAVLEVKTYTTRDRQLGTKAYTQLGKTISNGLGEAITYTHARLTEINPSLATRGASLMFGARTVERHVVIVHDDDKWADDVIDEMQKIVNSPSGALVVLVPSLRSVVARAYG